MQAASSPTLGRIIAALSPAPVAARPPRLLNYAVNNEGAFFPHFTASNTYFKTPLNNINDGNYWYTNSPPNRWTCYQTPDHSDWVTVDFGIVRPVRLVKAYLLDDGPGSGIQAPSRMELQYYSKGQWKRMPRQTQRPRIPEGHRPNLISFPTLLTEKLRLVLTHRPGAASGLTEFEAWGPGTLPLPPPTAPIADLAYNALGTGFPRATASFTSQFDRVEEVNDGKVFFSPGSRNRWTAYESPNRSDWVSIDFGAPKRVAVVKLYIFGDGGGVQAPASYNIQYWNGADWIDAAGQVKTPPEPTAGAENTVRITPVSTSRIRVVLTHPRNAFSGLTEMEVFGP